MTIIVTKNSMRQNGGDCDVIGCDVTYVRSSPEMLKNNIRYNKMVAVVTKNRIPQNDGYCDVTYCDVTAIKS